MLTFQFLLCAFIAQGVELRNGPKVTPTSDGATVEWVTDVPAGTRLSYGTNDKLLTHREEGPVTAEHRVEVKGLTAGTTYYFSIGTARVQLATGSFSTLGEGPAKPAATVVEPPKKSLLQRLFSKPSVPSKPPTSATIKAPPTAQTWGHLDSLQDHFDRHGPDFKATSPDDYAAQAWRFLQRAKQEALPMKWDDADRSLRVFDPKTRAFASYDSRGKTRTYFRPNNPDYWNRQPGRIIQPSQLPF